MATHEWDLVEAAADAALADFDGVLAVVGDAIRENVPEYAYVTDEELRHSTRHNVAALLGVLRDRRTLTDDEVRGFEETVEIRARQGVALDQYLLAVSVAEAAAWNELWRHAPQPPTPPTLSEAYALRVAMLNTITRVTAAAHRRIELLRSRAEYERRAASLRSLLRGGLSGESVREHCARLGVDPQRPYLVVRARARDGVDSDQVERRLAGLRNRPPHAVFVLWGEDVVGLMSEFPKGHDQLCAGVAGPLTPERLGPAHEAAQVALSTAWSLGLSGAYTKADLGLRAAVSQVPDVGETLRQKYVAPLLDGGNLGTELLATVRAYLEAGSRRDGAASQLYIHINTVGYRLSRFTEITGADLTDFSTLAELWWLFADLDQRPP